MKPRVYHIILGTVSATLMAGCGTVASQDAQGQSGPDPDVTVQKVNSLYTQIYGDAAVRQAIRVTAWADYRNTMTDCMQELGYQFQGSPYLDLGYPGVADMSLPLPPTADTSVQEYALYVATWWNAQPWPAPPENANGEGQLPPDEIAAQTRCEESNQPSNPGGWPALANDLYGEFASSLQDAVDSDEVRGQIDNYPNCMDSLGYRVESREQLRSSFDRRYARLFQGTSDPRTSEEWAETVSQEVLAAQADAECRRDMFAATMTKAAPLLDKFESDHAEDLDNLASLYAQLIENAHSVAYAAGLDVAWYTPGAGEPPLVAPD